MRTKIVAKCITVALIVFIMCRQQVLNEVVIDRGQSPFLSNIDLFIEHKHVTTVQGDGKIESTNVNVVMKSTCQVHHRLWLHLVLGTTGQT